VTFGCLVISSTALLMMSAGCPRRMKTSSAARVSRQARYPRSWVIPSRIVFGPSQILHSATSALRSPARMRIRFGLSR